MDHGLSRPELGLTPHFQIYGSFPNETMIAKFMDKYGMGENTHILLHKQS